MSKTILIIICIIAIIVIAFSIYQGKKAKKQAAAARVIGRFIKGSTIHTSVAPQPGPTTAVE